MKIAIRHAENKDANFIAWIMLTAARSGKATGFWDRKCMKQGCKNEFETSYAPERPEIIYCESCYNSEVA